MVDVAAVGAPSGRRAEYVGWGSTNVFAVKSVAALKDALAGKDFRVEEVSGGKLGAVRIWAASADGGGFWLQWLESEKTRRAKDFCVPDMISKHLRDGEVAVFMHVGVPTKEPRLIGGYSEAVHSDGRQVRVNLSDIYSIAASTFAVDEDHIGRHYE